MFTCQSNQLITAHKKNKYLVTKDYEIALAWDVTMFLTFGYVTQVNINSALYLEESKKTNLVGSPQT